MGKQGFSRGFRKHIRRVVSGKPPEEKKQIRKGYLKEKGLNK